MEKINIAIVGATGLVGNTFLKILDEYKIEINNLYLYASQKSAGKKILFKNEEYIVEELKEENIINKKIDYALFSAGGSISRKYAEIFIKHNCIVIDNSSAFRQDKSVPLIVPEVNPLKNPAHLIANPNCSTIQCMPPLKIIHNLFSLKRVDYVTFQAVSGSGMKGIKDLERNKHKSKSVFYPHQIYNNILPHIGNFDKYGYSEEENKMINETRKILNIPSLPISATCVRVPVKNSHSVEILVTTKKKINLEKLITKLSTAKGIKLVNDCEKNLYPMPILATNTDDVLVGRIRIDKFDKHKLHLFCVADNIRKGAASNAIQILQGLLKLNT